MGAVRSPVQAIKRTSRLDHEPLTFKRTKKLEAVIADRENFDQTDRRALVAVLRQLAKKLYAYADALESPGDGLRTGEHQEAARRAGARQFSHS